MIGYGKMGKTIERIAHAQGEDVIGHIDIDTEDSERLDLMLKADVGIEFSHPSGAYNNIKQALYHGLPIISGTTGWLSQLPEITALVAETKGAFFYASNYSIGVNIFWSVNERLAQLMNDHSMYEVSIREVHHIHKQDQPSGTAITTADGITDYMQRKHKWTLSDQPSQDEIRILAEREGEVFGIHTVSYDSPLDTISLHHEAHTRDGFAQGALLAAKWLYGKQGIYGMKDLLGF